MCVVNDEHYGCPYWDVIPQGGGFSKLVNFHKDLCLAEKRLGKLRGTLSVVGGQHYDDQLWGPYRKTAQNVKKYHTYVQPTLADSHGSDILKAHAGIVLGTEDITSNLCSYLGVVEVAHLEQASRASNKVWNLCWNFPGNFPGELSVMLCSEVIYVYIPIIVAAAVSASVAAQLYM